MPTGYTHEVCEGKVTEFSTFAMICARAFGALIMMRDDPMDTPIPNEMKPDTQYYDNNIANNTERLNEIQAMTLEDCETAALEAHRQASDYRKKYLADKDAEASRLNSMLAKVRAWGPPTSDHVGIKDFMIEQLTISLPGDYAPSIPPLLDGATWRQQEIDRLSDTIVYHQKERSKEIDRSSARTKWVNDLRASLLPADSARK